jgi:hypothetical protein
VGHGNQTDFVIYVIDQVERGILGGAASTIGNRNKRWGELHELSDIYSQFQYGRITFRWEKFK